LIETELQKEEFAEWVVALVCISLYWRRSLYSKRKFDLQSLPLNQHESF